MKTSDFFKTYNNVLDSLNVLRNESKEVIKDALSSHGNTFVVDEINDYLSITYFGGNHPEYASNAFSRVISVNLKPNGDIVVETEDCEEIHSEDIMTLDLADIAEQILNNYKDED